MHFTELDLKEAIIEDDIDKLVFSSDDWIVMKDLDVFVKVGTTDHPAKIDSMVRLSEELVDTKLLRVKWVINNKKEVVDISSVRPMYSSEGNNQNRRSTKPSKPPSVVPLRTQKSKEGLLEESTYPRKLLVGLSYKCKHYINCNSLPAKQKAAKMVEKTKRMPEKMVTFRDNFRLYQQERSIESSLSCEVMLTAGMEMYKEEDVMDSVLTACNGFAVKLSPQSSLAKCLCLMVYSCSNEVCNVDVDMTDNCDCIADVSNGRYLLLCSIQKLGRYYTGDHLSPSS